MGVGGFRVKGLLQFGTQAQRLGSPVVPFCPFSFWVCLLKPNSRKKGTLIIKELLGDLEDYSRHVAAKALRTSGRLRALRVPGFGFSACSMGFRV